MFNLDISRHRITHDFTDLGPTCVRAPPIQLVLSETHYKLPSKSDQGLSGSLHPCSPYAKHHSAN